MPKARQPSARKVVATSSRGWMALLSWISHSQNGFNAAAGAYPPHEVPTYDRRRRPSARMTTRYRHRWGSAPPRPGPPPLLMRAEGAAEDAADAEVDDCVARILPVARMAGVRQAT